MACQVGDYGSYGEALVMLGHSNTEIAGRHVKRVPVPYGTCIVNINPVGVDATFGQIMAVVEVMQECAARGMPIFLDPCNNKAAIEHEVNSRIQKIGGNSSPIQLSITIGGQDTPESSTVCYTNISGSYGNMVGWSGLFKASNIHELPGSVEHGNKFWFVKRGLQENVTYTALRGCYWKSVYPTPELVDKAWSQFQPGVNPIQLGERPFSDWNQFFGMIGITNEYAFKLAQAFSPNGRGILYNLSCRGGEVTQGMETRQTFGLHRQLSEMHQAELGLRGGKKYRKKRNSRKQRKTRKSRK